MAAAPIQVDLSHRGYAQIPEEIDERVATLSLASNRIHSLHNIGRFSRLKQVDLSSNKIVSLLGINALEGLAWLKLSHNSIASLDGLEHLVRLEHLEIADNALTDIDALQLNTALTYIDASANSIDVWPRFLPLIHLEVLNLNENQLRAFRNLHTVLPTNLRHLKLAHNDIEHLACLESCQRHLTALESLELAGNRCLLGSPHATTALTTIFPKLVMLDGAPILRAPTPSLPVETDMMNREAKIQLWKQTLLERSQQEQKERQRWQNEKQDSRDKTLRYHYDKSQLDYADQPSPEIDHALDEPPLAHVSTFLPPSNNAKRSSRTNELQKELHALQENVQQMRKYMKVWVKREQWLREKSAVCIQKHYRGARARRRLPKKDRPAQRAPHAWMSRPVHASSCMIPRRGIPPERRVFHIYAQSIQAIARGYFTRLRLCRWKMLNNAAIQIQRHWRGYILRQRHLWMHGKRTPSAVALKMLRSLQDVSHRVRKLERRFSIQDEAMIELWNQVQSTQRAAEASAHRQFLRTIVRLQARWRGKIARRAFPLLPKPLKSCHAMDTAFQEGMKTTLSCSQCDVNAREILALREELAALKQLIFVQRPLVADVCSPVTRERGQVEAPCHNRQPSQIDIVTVANPLHEDKHTHGGINFLSVLPFFEQPF
ncbi:hypothetical protein AC1031_008572 [Aphanomyces cochlioides]|nr:hypothetical protein AC1031_008572 [Aphanomyces cochlioides]